MAREKSTVNKIVRELERLDIKFINKKGSHFGDDDGEPDIIAIDPRNGLFLGIEAKRWGEKVHVNQFNVCEQIIKNKGRYIIAFPDFDIEEVLAYSIPKINFKGNDMKTFQETHEIVLEGGDA